MSQTMLQRGPLQQTAASPSPGAELYPAASAGTLCPAQKPSSPNTPAAGSQPESAWSCGIDGRGHPRDTPVSVGIMGTLPAPPKVLSRFLLSHLLLQALRLCRGRASFLLTDALWLCTAESFIFESSFTNELIINPV